MPFKNGSKLCICEICNCGRHRCPHHPQARAPAGPCTISEYSNKYIQHPLRPVTSCKPAVVAAGCKEPLADETTTRVDYVPHPLAARVPLHQAEAYRPPEGAMDGDTVYNTTYTEKRGPRAIPVRHDVKRRELGRFEGEPTYRNDYRQWPLCKPERAQTVLTWSPPRDPFEGVPTYVSDYIGHRGAPQLSCKPTAVALHSSSPFEDATDYRQSYVRHPLEARIARAAAEKVRLPSAQFEGMTTHQRDFTPKEGGRAGTCKPANVALASLGPLQSDTTNRIDYRAWDGLSRPQQHQPDVYKAPDGEFYDDTTYLRDYPRHPLAAKLVGKPKERARELGPFQGSTDYRDSYQRWQVPGRANYGPSTVYHAPAEPFGGESTHHAHFIEHPIDPRRSCKPEPRRDQSAGAFDDATMYRSEYTPKMSEPCPAALLESPRSHFVYREQDAGTGHKFYEPLRLSASVSDLRVPVAAS